MSFRPADQIHDTHSIGSSLTALVNDYEVQHDSRKRLDEDLFELYRVVSNTDHERKTLLGLGFSSNCGPIKSLTKELETTGTFLAKLEIAEKEIFGKLENTLVGLLRYGTHILPKHVVFTANIDTCHRKQSAVSYHAR